MFVVLHMCLWLEVYRYLKCDSCQYFAGMLIHFRFGDNFALSILFCPIFRESHAKFFLGSKILFCSTPQATMVRTMTEGIVNRFLRSAKAEMLQKNETEIRCPCRRCKLESLIADPDSGQVLDHLLLRGFMDGYRWQGDEDDYEVVRGRRRARNGEGQQDKYHRREGGREDEESQVHDHDGDAVHCHHVEDVIHDDEEDQDEGHDHEDEDAGVDDD